jgi:cytochrome oxidase Cu insertion factor (SCO1/SenC/PrrC family)
MRILSFALVCAGSAAGLLAQQPAAPAKPIQPPKTFLKVGDQAPDFTLPATDRTRVTLSSFKGKFNVVLAFFPAAFTGG